MVTPRQWCTLHVSHAFFFLLRNILNFNVASTDETLELTVQWKTRTLKILAFEVTREVEKKKTKHQQPYPLIRKLGKGEEE